MSDNKVIPFRRRETKPTASEFEIYCRMTRNWSEQMRQLMFPQFAGMDITPTTRESK